MAPFYPVFDVKQRERHGDWHGRLLWESRLQLQPEVFLNVYRQQRRAR